MEENGQEERKLGMSNVIMGLCMNLIMICLLLTVPIDCAGPQMKFSNLHVSIRFLCTSSWSSSASGVFFCLGFLLPAFFSLPSDLGFTGALARIVAITIFVAGFIDFDFDLPFRLAGVMTSSSLSSGAPAVF
jgi:hypothetical protein